MLKKSNNRATRAAAVAAKKLAEAAAKAVKELINALASLGGGTALSYFDGYTTNRLPANLLQAQRDYFGAHTYERLDAPRGQFFHTNWTGHGGNTAASIYNA